MGPQATTTGRKPAHARVGWVLLATAPGAVCACLLLTAVATSASGSGVPVPVNLPLPTPTLPAVDPPPLPTALPTLPTSLPTVSPPALPTPSLPVTLPTPSPSIPGGLLPSPSPSASPTPQGGAGGSGSSSGGAGGSGGGQGPGGGFTIPLTGIVIRSPLDAALLGAIASLPLLFGIWLLLFGRTWAAARRSRDAQIRLAIAHDLGLHPRELLSVSTEALFKLREEAAFDELTGVMRRAAGISALDREIARARRQKAPLSVAFVDLDGLKETNDKRGHKAGDDLLRSMAALLKGALRAQDLVMRYGGDEFVCVLPDTVADAGRAKISWIQTEAEAKGIGFSVGVAQLERADDVVSLLGRADTEMYAVKSRRVKIRDIRLGVVGGGGGKSVPA
jgi:diguanylate cyclase (GGDEF)-like protein